MTSQSGGTVTRIDPRSRNSQPINVGNGPTAVAVGAGSVWVANTVDGTVSRIDPVSSRQTSLIQVGAGPGGISAQADTVWVSSEQGGTLSRIDPKRNKVVQTLETGNQPEGVAISQGTMYVAVRSSGLVHRGGTLTVAAHGKLDGSKADNIDLARSTFWSLTWLTNDGLTGYKRVGAGQGYRLVADLATSLPTPSDGGRTYTFQVHRGIRYSTGQLVRPADFRRSIERVLADPRAYGGSYYAGIVGASRCLKEQPKRCDLARGIFADAAAYTVTFRLTAPDPDFLYELAVPSADAVPANTPMRAKLPLPATGPYMFSNYVGGKHGVIRLVRNPHFHAWSAAAQPDGFPDVIVEKYGYTLESALRAVEQGAADVTDVDADNISPSRLSALRISYAGQLHQAPQLVTTWYWLHTREPPFNDVRVRRAVSYAVDRNRTLTFNNGFALPTCQVLPPNLFGYRRYCPYTVNPAGGTYNGPDPAKARQLVAASGTKGMRVVVWTIKGFWEGPPRYLVSVLDSLG